jgi:hypothetical protein
VVVVNVTYGVVVVVCKGVVVDVVVFVVSVAVVDFKSVPDVSHFDSRSNILFLNKLQVPSFSKE